MQRSCVTETMYRIRFLRPATNAAVSAGIASVAAPPPAPIAGSPYVNEALAAPSSAAGSPYVNQALAAPSSSAAYDAAAREADEIAQAIALSQAAAATPTPRPPSDSDADLAKARHRNRTRRAGARNCRVSRTTFAHRVRTRARDVRAARRGDPPRKPNRAPRRAPRRASARRGARHDMRVWLRRRVCVCRRAAAARASALNPNRVSLFGRTVAVVGSSVAVARASCIARRLHRRWRSRRRRTRRAAAVGSRTSGSTCGRSS